MLLASLRCRPELSPPGPCVGQGQCGVILDNGARRDHRIFIPTSWPCWAAVVDMYLMNLTDGAVAGSKAEMNRQGPLRCRCCFPAGRGETGKIGGTEPPGEHCGELSDLLKTVVLEHDVSPKDIHLLAVAGNTAMTHLMAGWGTTGLAEASFLPTALESSAFIGKKIGLTEFPRLRIWLLPLLSAYVATSITGGLGLLRFRGGGSRHLFVRTDLTDDTGRLVENIEDMPLPPTGASRRVLHQRRGNRPPLRWVRGVWLSHRG